MAFTCQSCYTKQLVGRKKSKKAKIDAKVKAAEEFTNSWGKSFGPCEDCRKPRVCGNL